MLHNAYESKYLKCLKHLHSTVYLQCECVFHVHIVITVQSSECCGTPVLCNSWFVFTRLSGLYTREAKTCRSHSANKSQMSLWLMEFMFSELILSTWRKCCNSKQTIISYFIITAHEDVEVNLGTSKTVNQKHNYPFSSLLFVLPASSILFCFLMYYYYYYTPFNTLHLIVIMF